MSELCARRANGAVLCRYLLHSGATDVLPSFEHEIVGDYYWERVEPDRTVRIAERKDGVWHLHEPGYSVEFVT